MLKDDIMQNVILHCRDPCIAPQDLTPQSSMRSSLSTRKPDSTLTEIGLIDYWRMIPDSAAAPHPLRLKNCKLSLTKSQSMRPRRSQVGLIALGCQSPGQRPVWVKARQTLSAHCGSLAISVLLTEDIAMQMRSSMMALVAYSCHLAPVSAISSSLPSLRVVFCSSDIQCRVIGHSFRACLPRTTKLSSRSTPGNAYWRRAASCGFHMATSAPLLPLATRKQSNGQCTSALSASNCGRRLRMIRGLFFNQSWSCEVYFATMKLCDPVLNGCNMYGNMVVSLFQYIYNPVIPRLFPLFDSVLACAWPVCILFVTWLVVIYL